MPLPSTRFSMVALLVPLALLTSGLLVGCGQKSGGSGATTSPASTGNIASDAVAAYGQNVVHQPLEAGKKTECQSNLQQLRTAIQMHKDSEGSFPASLAELGTQLTALEKCPSSGQPYQYDPAAGRVWCTTPGHERL